MARKPAVICMYCNKSFYREDEPYIQVNSRRYAHQECGEAAQEIHNLMARKCGEAYSKEKINTQINKFIKDGYKIKEIRDTIFWWFDIKNEDASKANGGIGIFSYVYPNYLEYKKTQIKRLSINKGKNIDDYVDHHSLEIFVSPTPVKKPKRVNLFSFE